MIDRYVLSGAILYSIYLIKLSKLSIGYVFSIRIFNSKHSSPRDYRIA